MNEAFNPDSTAEAAFMEYLRAAYAPEIVAGFSTRVISELQQAFLAGAFWYLICFNKLADTEGPDQQIQLRMEAFMSRVAREVEEFGNGQARANAIIIRGAH